MLFELALGTGLLIAGIAFFTEYIDSTLGMGYGTTLTPLLLLMGYEPFQIVPAVLLSELITGLLAGFTHHSVGNADFRPKTMNPLRIFKAIRNMGIFDSFKKGIPTNLRVVLLISACSLFGTLFAIAIAVRIPTLYLKIYIGALILVIGLFILMTLNKEYSFSWKKVTGLSLVASFNKGMSGGGYGPVVTGGQILSGVDGKNAVAVTSLAEGLTCIVGVLAYMYSSQVIDWKLAPYLIIGAVLSVPISALSVKKIKTNRLRLLIGILTVILGGITLWKVLSEISLG